MRFASPALSLAKHTENSIRKALSFNNDEPFISYEAQIDYYIRFRTVCAPDFSTTDIPLVMQIYDHYCKRWLAAYWQTHGLTTYPIILRVRRTVTPSVSMENRQTVLRRRPVW